MDSITGTDEMRHDLANMAGRIRAIPASGVAGCRRHLDEVRDAIDRRLEEHARGVTADVAAGEREQDEYEGTRMGR